ncbi:MAG: radical SAM protein [Candidatus Cloacimonetes bacterium]|nr:radical SAM protein [Candidatus Cloacimonadota bacterium]
MKLKPLIGKMQHIPWMVSHMNYYLYLNTRILARGVPLRELLILKYPFLLPDAKKPPLLSVDITDACDLECVYCNNPLFPHPRTMMPDKVVECLLKQLEQSKINRVRIGGGEPTLHPKFASITKELAQRTKFLSIVTNGQWKEPDMAEQLIKSGLDFIEISVDAGGAEVYERSRGNASYKLLMTNLANLRFQRDKLKSKAIIKVRLMLRPSTMHLEREESRKLLKYCDCVHPQWLLQHPESDYKEDVFMQRSIAQNVIPVCSVPFRDLQLRPDGKIPLCPAKGCSIYPENQQFIGDICTDSLLDVWNGGQMSQIRKAHRSRTGDVLQECLGCHYG